MTGPDPDRPRYRVLAVPWYDHSPHTTTPTGHFERDCVAGHELTIYRVDETWRHVGGPYFHEPLGVTQVEAEVRGVLSVARARLVVVDWLRTRAAPRATHVLPGDVAVFTEVT